MDVEKNHTLPHHKKREKKILLEGWFSQGSPIPEGFCFRSKEDVLEGIIKLRAQGCPDARTPKVEDNYKPKSWDHAS
ncbi:Biotin carboxylase [Sesbania bispinosa]|nr:Biotin carboxylase [Sesbania bispinosa]